MPLHKIDKICFTREGMSCTAQRLVYRIGSSNRLAQVLEFGGRQVVDEALYEEKDEQQMRCAAKGLLLTRLGGFA